MVESRHFRRNEPPWLLGRKCLAVNLSDIAAMGGRPTGFLLSLGIPSDLPRGFIDSMLDGLAAAAAEQDVPILGGDTSGSVSSLFISITILGAMPRRTAPIIRSGARPGDGVYVSGALGGSAAGRRLLEAGWTARASGSRRGTIALRAPRGARAARPLRARAMQAVRAHLDPTPRLELGRQLAGRRLASSAMDISDGLSLDLARLCAASGVGASVWAHAVPIADAARALAGQLGATPLDLALNGGEDYELVFTVPPSREGRLDHSGLDAFCIGRIVRRAAGLRLQDAAGRLTPLRPAGFDHFRG